MGAAPQLGARPGSQGRALATGAHGIPVPTGARPPGPSVSNVVTLCPAGRAAPQWGARPLSQGHALATVPTAFKTGGM